MVIFRSIHVPADGTISFFFMAEQYSIVYVYVPYLFCPFLCDGHLGCFHDLVVLVLLWTQEYMYLFEL